MCLAASAATGVNFNSPGRRVRIVMSWKICLRCKVPVGGQVCRVMMKLSRRQGPGRQKSMSWAVKGRMQGRTAKLLLARWISRCYVGTLHITPLLL
jgi:hypothetical protein